MVNKKKQTMLYLTPRMAEMVEAIKNETGASTVSAVFFQAVTREYQRLFPNYAAKRGIGGVTEDPAEIGKRKAIMKAAEKETKDKIAVEEKRNICEVSLHGEVVEEIDGLYCKFNTYNYGEADEQKVPLEMVSEEFASHQNTDPTK